MLLITNRSVIMFIVEDVTYNVCDQKFHEFEIRKQNPSVYVIRKTLTEVANEGKLMEDKRLFVDNQEVKDKYTVISCKRNVNINILLTTQTQYLG